MARLATQLPESGDASGAVVVLRLRDVPDMQSTAVRVLHDEFRSSSSIES